MLPIEVVYASTDQQVIQSLEVPPGTSVQAAIEQSSVLHLFPEIDLTTLIVGIFSERVSLGDLVNAGDRIEIYRPLTLDPKQKRRLKAKQQKR